MSVKQIAQTLRSSKDKDLQQVGLALKLLADGTPDSSGSSTSTSTETGATATLLMGPTGLAATGSLTDTDGILAVNITGNLPAEPNLAGFRFIVERPAPGDVDAEHLTLPGVVQNDVRVWYSAGASGAFAQTIYIRKPAGRERILIYVLSFSEDYDNPFVRLASQSPAAPANVTPYAVLDIGDSLTVAGSELGDITLTGTPVKTATGLGTLRVVHQYVPPYLASPIVSIGDFQGVTVYLVDETGAITPFPDQLYRPPVAFDADPPGNLGSFQVDIPMPSVGATVHLVVCAYSTTKHLPFRDPGVAPSTIVVEITIDAETSGAALATQVGAFAVTVVPSSLTGVASGGKQGTFHITYNRPLDPKWKAVWIERIFTDAAFTPLPGQNWSTPFESTAGFEDFGPWPWPTTNQFFLYRARSINAEGVPNDIAAPTVPIALLADGTFVLAHDAVAEAMLQDLAVTARALADAAVTSSKYAPLSITAVAVGIAAINDANIASLNVGKLTPTAGNATISVGGTLLLEGSSSSVAINSGGATVNGGLAVNGASLLTGFTQIGLTAFDANILVSSEGLFLSGFGNPAAVIAELLPGYAGHSGQFLSNDGTGLFWDTPSGGGGGVSSIFGRTGAVSAAFGDYSAADISGLGTAAVANLGAGSADAAYGNHNHDSAYAPLEYYPGQTVNEQLLYLTDDLDAGLGSATIDLTTATTLMVSKGRITGYA